MNKNEHEEEANNKNKIIDKIDMDNGNFPYAKDIGKTLAKTTLSGSHRAIIDVILDKTYGWYDPQSDKIQKLKKRKIKELITYRNFEDFTGIARNHLSKFILDLVNWKVIKRWEKGQYYIYSFNVNVNQWNKGIFKKSVTGLGDTLKCHRIRGHTVTDSGDTLSPIQGTLAESKTNENVNIDKGLRSAEKPSKETILNNYIKKEGKEDIYIGKNLKEEKEIFDYWNSLNIIEHKTIDFFKNDIKEVLKNYSLSEIKDTIGNYSLILKDEKYYYSHKHTISGFLDPKNFDKFRDLERAKDNYLIRKVNNGIDNESVEYERYKPDSIKKETEEERKARYKSSEDKIKKLKEELNSSGTKETQK